MDRITQRSQRTPPVANRVTDKRRPLSDDDEYEYDDVLPSRMPSSMRRYHSDARMESGRAQADVQAMAVAKDAQMSGRKNAIPPRRTATQTSVPVARTGQQRPRETEDVFAYPGLSRHHHRVFNWSRFHWLVYIGLALLVMIIGWICLSSFASWWQVKQDDWHYGRPRTFQSDFVVGHGDASTTPSHFIALNLNRHIEIIELSGGDASKTKVYTGPVLIGQDQDLAVVTLSFKDVNGDGKPDMIVNIQDSRFVFINDNGSFRQARPGEVIQMS